MQSRVTKAFTLEFDDYGGVKSKQDFTRTFKSQSLRSLHIPSHFSSTRDSSHITQETKASDPSVKLRNAVSFVTELKETDNKSSEPFSALISECSMLHSLAVSTWHEATSKIADCRQSFASLNKLVGVKETTSWNTAAQYLRGKRKIKAVQAKKTKQNLAKHMKVIKSVLEDSDCEEHVYLSPKDLNTKNIFKLLQINRRSFGAKRSPGLRFSERTSPQPCKPKGFMREPFDAVLMREIEEYKQAMLPELEIEYDDLRKKFRAVAVEEQEKLYSQLHQMSPLNQLVLRRKKKFIPRLRSQFNYRRNQQLDSLMDKIHPSQQVVERAVKLMLSRTPLPKLSGLTSPKQTLSGLVTPTKVGEFEGELLTLNDKVRLEALMRSKRREHNR
jgi:hypothetical protein